MKMIGIRECQHRYCYITDMRIYRYWIFPYRSYARINLYSQSLLFFFDPGNSGITKASKVERAVGHLLFPML